VLGHPLPLWERAAARLARRVRGHYEGWVEKALAAEAAAPSKSLTRADRAVAVPESSGP